MAKLKTLTRDEASELKAKGWRFTCMSLYEPDHAPKGTMFRLIDNRPYRLWAPNPKLGETHESP